MDSKLHKILAALGAVAISLSTPAFAGDDGKSGMMMGHGGMGMMNKGMMMGHGGMGMMGGDMMSGGMMMKAMHALDLDRDQVRKMIEIRKGVAQQRAGTQVEIQELRWQLAQEMQKDQPNPEEAGKIYEQIAQKKKALLQAKLQARNEMMGVLSQEQMQKMKEMKKRMHMKMQGMGGEEKGPDSKGKHDH